MMQTESSLVPNKSPSESGHHRLWISDQWYILVDNLGTCVGPCLEGALGFVIQLSSSKDNEHRLALKLPKLMGETHRENAYISDLMDKELKAVQDIFLREEGQSEGLLPAQLWTRGGPMRGQINTRKGPAEAQAWDGAIILVHFEKGHRPRFCLVKMSDEKKVPSSQEQSTQANHPKAQMVWFPTTIVECPISTVEMYEAVEKCASSGSKNSPEGLLPWDGTVFIDLGKGADMTSVPMIMNKQLALKQEPTGDTWYTSVPSVPYWWAPGTLQRAISLNKRGVGWGVSEHFSLAQRICMGIYALHSNQMLHADLRPANIAYRGDPTTPENYYVLDYGSFAEMGARDAERSPTGDTVLGPVAGTERTSAFYAPERRGGKEREAADFAVIRNAGGTSLDVVLGWQSELADDISGILAKSKNSSEASQPPNGGSTASRKTSTSGSSLLKGDRIQIRDYIFDIIRAAEVDDKQVLQCNSRSWKIYQGRIVVENTEPFDGEKRLPIPRTVELQQWSAATDLFGLGALLLYSVYRSEQPELKETSARIEETFREMLSYLEGEPYFNNIWPELESLREQLEENLAKDTVSSAERFGALRFKKGSNGKNDEDTTLKQETISVVRRITQTVPWSRRLVEVFDFNLGPFIFFIHFVLCCLHRRSHLTEPDNEKLVVSGESRNREKPFCENRLEPPKVDGGASRALIRLKTIQKLVPDRRLSSLKTDSGVIPGFDPRPDPLIRAAYYFLSEEAKKVVAYGLKSDSSPLVKAVILFVKAVMWIAGLKEPFSQLDRAIKRSQRSDLLMGNSTDGKGVSNRI